MEPPELTPAEFDGAPRNRYRPRLPWRRIGLVLLVAALIAGAYFWRQKVRADQLRARIQTLHAERVAPVLDTLDATRTDLEQKALDAKSGAANRLVRAKVRLSELHDEKVVYLKVRAPELRSEETLRAAIEAEDEDAIGSCLGLEMIALSALSDVPEVLTSKWLARADETNEMQRLSVREEQLTRAIERELPALQQRVPADYFLLLVVQGKSRLRDPVDVFLWDLDSDELVLRSRTENRGRLITVRSQIGPKSDAAKAAGDPIVTADCSIAAHVKAQLGEPTMDLATPD
jgi:cell division protein FtsB